MAYVSVGFGRRGRGRDPVQQAFISVVLMGLIVVATFLLIALFDRPAVPPPHTTPVTTYDAASLTSGTITVVNNAVITSTESGTVTWVNPPDGNAVTVTNGTITAGGVLSGTTVVMIGDQMHPIDPRFYAEDTAAYQRIFLDGKPMLADNGNGHQVPCYVPAYPMTAEQDAGVHAFAARHHLPIFAVADQYCVDP
jgi:hypothetical protein